MQVTGKLAEAINLIITEGKEMDAAAAAVGITTRRLRLALEKPHVIRHMKAEREVFRAYISAQNIHHARELRNQAGNAMARLGAMKFIEGMTDDPQARPAAAQAPGVVVVVVQGNIEPKPLIINQDQPDDE